LTDEVERLAPAKINLALHVVGCRADGYHDLDTLAVFADRGDRVAVSPGDGLTLLVAGPLAGHAPPGAENLVLRAAKLLNEHANFSGGAVIRLDKHIPAGAGLGGGSSDAAAALHALNELWELRLGLDDLIALGGRLGADLPMCLVGRALRAEGTGERIAPHPGMPALPIVLVWPGKPVSTPAAFAGLERRDNPPMPDLREARTPAEMANWLQGCRNDLEGPALRLAPEIGDALASLRGTPGCLLARMSGSGSACFAIYPAAEEAERAASIVCQAQPNWWVQAALAG
jgi:4-diphosphocytidyl-2-C-methyl-D-erythritol kinase